MKRIVSLLLALTLVVSAVGCGKKTPTEPKDIIKATQENAEKAKNLEAKLKFDLAGTLEADGEKQDLNTSITADVVAFVEPLKVKMDMTIDLSAFGLGKQELETYVAKEGEDYFTYVSVAGQWSKVKIEKELIEKSLKQEKEDKNDELSDKISESFINKGEVDLDGKKAIELEGKVTNSIMKEAVEKSGVLDEAEVSSYKSAITPFLDQLKDIPLKMYVDSKTMDTVKTTVDLKDVTQGIFDELMKQYSSLLTGGADVEIKLTFSKCNMEVTYDNYNKATDFEIPEDAKKAEEVDSSNALGIDNGIDEKEIVPDKENAADNKENATEKKNK